MLHAPYSDSLPEAWRALASCGRLGRPVRAYEEIDSTNTAAMTWARAGAPEGAVVVADWQSAGRGRHRRVWLAEPGQNLLFSLILRPRLPLEQLTTLPLLAGLAAARAIDAVASPLHTALKWPNDLLLDGKKCGGILLESSHPGDASLPPEAVVLGIGINLNQSGFPQDLAAHATSILLETGRFTARDALLTHLLAAFEPLYEALQAGTVSPAIAAYEERMYGRGEHVTVRAAGKPEGYEGMIEGVTASGALRLLTAAGSVELHAGEVSSKPIAVD